MKYDNHDYIELRKGLKIDPDDLDLDIITQAQQAYHAGEGFAIAVSVRDKKKFDLKVEEAKVSKDIREQMSADGERITEALVDAAIQRDQDYQRAYIAFLDSSKTADEWQALRESYRDRRDMLKELNARQRARMYDDVADASERKEARERFDRKRV